MMTISVIIPYHNGLDHIGRAVKSVLAQTHQVDEIIIVDDASSNPLNLFDLVDDNRIRILRLDRNVGGSGARNIGISESKCSHIALLDCDDEWTPEKIEKQVHKLQECGEDDRFLVLCGTVISEYNKKLNKTTLSRPIVSPLESILVDGSFLQTSTFFMKREYALKIGFDASLRKHQDWDFLHRWYLAGNQFIYIDEALSIYHRGSPGQVSRTRQVELSRKWIGERKNDISSRAAAKFYLSEIYPFEFGENPFYAMRSLVMHIRAGNLKLYEGFKMTKYAIRIAFERLTR